MFDGSRCKIWLASLLLLYVFDEIKPFDGKTEAAGYYYVETNNYFPIQSNGYYIADLIDYALNKNFIKLEDIKHQLNHL